LTRQTFHTVSKTRAKRYTSETMKIGKSGPT
jgi:hypothetical protein